MKVRTGDVELWIGHHDSLGLLIHDPRVQNRVENNKVRLFKVATQQSAAFMKDILREGVSSQVPNPGEAQQAALDYARVWDGMRNTHCYSCKEEINSVDFSICPQCGWIRCTCGACGCGFQRFDT